MSFGLLSRKSARPLLPRTRAPAASARPRIPPRTRVNRRLRAPDAFKYCSPSRCALQSGRSPIHVNVLNNDFREHNPADPVSGMQGIPTNMTTIAAKLKGAGYATHAVGK